MVIHFFYARCKTSKTKTKKTLTTTKHRSIFNSLSCPFWKKMGGFKPLEAWRNLNRYSLCLLPGQGYNSNGMKRVGFKRQHQSSQN
jgi:hypothetical protein